MLRHHLVALAISDAQLAADLERYRAERDRLEADKSSSSARTVYLLLVAGGTCMVPLAIALAVIVLVFRKLTSGVEDAIDDFAVKVAARPLPVVAVEPWDPVTVSRRPRLEVTLAENTHARLDQLACYVGGQGEVPVEWLDGGRRFAVTPRDDLDYGRARVNCTAPAAEGGRFHWFCHPWIVRSREGP